MIREVLAEECDKPTQFDITGYRSTWDSTCTPDNEKQSGKYPRLWTSVLPEQYQSCLHEDICTEIMRYYPANTLNYIKSLNYWKPINL